MKAVRSKTAARELPSEWQQELDSGVEICFLLQDLDDAYNVGGLFRVADGVGASELICTGKTPVPPNPMISVTSLGAHRRISCRYFKHHLDAVDALKAEGWSLVALEIADGAANFRQFSYPTKTCLILGNEANGVYGSVLAKVDSSVFIPMFGKGRSLNVHVAAAIVAFEARLRR
jgi:23S rRNA (guanosine2251-2'-O)-methyltransferase